jgi:hypothetical protein
VPPSGYFGLSWNKDKVTTSIHVTAEFKHSAFTCHLGLATSAQSLRRTGCWRPCIPCLNSLLFPLPSRGLSECVCVSLCVCVLCVSLPHTKYHRLGNLNDRHCLTVLERLGAPAIGSTVSFWGMWRKMCSRVFSLAYRRSPSLCLWFFHVCVILYMSSFHKDTGPVESGPS